MSNAFGQSLTQLMRRANEAIVRADAVRTIDPAELERRQLARDDFYFFVCSMFSRRRGFEWQRATHHALICAALMRVYLGECRRLIINIPPRYSKTELAVVNWIAWCLGHAPDSEFIHTSYSSTLAETNAGNVLGLVQHEAYRGIFPRVEIEKNSQAHWTTSAGGVVYSAGAGGTITGFGAGKNRPGFGGAIIADDVHKPDEIRSDTVRKGVLDWFQNTLESRRNAAHTPIIVIGQRLHEADLSGWLLDGGNGEKWEHLCLPTPQADGTALWPEKHDVETLKRMEAAAPYMFAGQYGQTPSPPAGAIFKPDNIRIIDAIPAGAQFARGWDLASVAGGGDWTVGGKVGRTSDGRYVIADVVRFQGSPDQVEAALKNTAARDTGNTRIRIPQDPGQAGKAQVANFVRQLAGYSVTALPISGDKVTRAEPFAAQVNVGNVDMVRAEWNDALVSEMRMFPNGRHDDQVDALSDAFSMHITNNIGFLEYMRQQLVETRGAEFVAELDAKREADFAKFREAGEAAIRGKVTP